jgi:hypothetical protein
MNNEIVKKHSALIQTNVRELTLYQRKSINFLILAMQIQERKSKRQKVSSDDTYIVPIDILIKLCGISKKDYKELRKQLRDLMSIVIEFNYLGKDSKSSWVATTFLSYIEIQKSGDIHFRMDRWLKEKVISPDMFCPINTKLLSNISHSSAIPLYEFLKDYINSPHIPLLTLDEIKNLLGVGDKYKNGQFGNRDFRVRTLEPAIKEINEKLDIKAKYRLIKRGGNKYTHIDFYDVKRKPDSEIKPIDKQLSLFEPDEYDLVRAYISSLSPKKIDPVKEDTKEDRKKENDEAETILKLIEKLSTDDQEEIKTQAKKETLELNNSLDLNSEFGKKIYKIQMITLFKNKYL